jgi:hypothetical protein
MNARTIRRIALALIALLMYAQGSVALAACAMDRGAMDRGEMARAMAGHDCCDTSGDQSEPRLGNVCLAHCTAGLQAFELPVALVRAPADAAVLTVPVADAESPDPRGHSVHATLAVPPRILFQSFQI